MAESQRKPVLIEHLITRRTVPSVNLGLPKPDQDTLSHMLQMAARVPDHGKLAPWRFVIYPDGSGAEIGKRLSQFWQKEDADASSERLAVERDRFDRAPLVVGVISKPVFDHKIPVWEQELSAGAVCLNLVHAAYAFGFSAQWLTEWYSYHDEAARFLGAGEGERFAGFIHIGTPSIMPSERTRPNLDDITQVWSSR